MAAEPHPSTVADGYSRTDQRVPVATSTTPVAPPLDFDYNDGAADPESSAAGYGATGVREDGEGPDDGSDEGGRGPGESGMDRHLPHPDRPRLSQTHEGEHRGDHGDGGPRPAVTRRTKVFALCAALNSCNLGYDIGVNTGAGRLVQEGLGLSDLQLEIFFGSLNLFAMAGALGSHWVSDRLGRRWAFRVAAVGFIVGTVMQAGAGGYAALMAGRSFVGAGVGLGLAVDPVYISEISQAAHRGRLVTWSEVATNVGIVLGFASGLVFAGVEDGLAWRLMFALGAVMPCLVIYCSTFVMPESPRWLVGKGREEEARAVLRQVYPEGYDVSVIVQDIKDGIRREAIAEGAYGWDAVLFPSPAFKRMLLVGVGTAVAQQAVGIDAIQYFLSYILANAGVESRAAQTWILVGLGLVKLLVIVLAGSLFDRRGRRPLFFVSLLGMALSLALVSGAFVGGSDSSALAVVGLALYLAFFSVGMGPGAWLIPSEVFSTMVRAKAMSVATFANRVTATVMASTFLSVANAMTWAGFFVMMAVVCLLVLAWMYVYVPETKGRPLEEMALYFAEITGDRSLMEAEEAMYTRDADPSVSEEPDPTARQPLESEERRDAKMSQPPDRPPEDAHVVGTMA